MYNFLYQFRALLSVVEQIIFILEGFWNTEYCYRATKNESWTTTELAEHKQMHILEHNRSTTPVEEFWM